MHVLVCGSRHYSNRDALFKALDDIHSTIPITCVIHGAAPGADSLAGSWAKARNIDCQKFPAKWDLYGHAAGPIRNQEMLDIGRPDFIVAFTFEAGPGTRNMITLAKRAGLDVHEIHG